MNNPFQIRHESAARPLAGILFAGLVLAASVSVHATTGVWTNTASSQWTNTASWFGGVIPNGVGDVARFDQTNQTANRSISLITSKTVGAMYVGDPITTYSVQTFNWSSVNLSAANPMSASQLIFDQTGAGNATLNFPIAASTAQNVFNTYVTLNDDLVITTDTGVGAYHYLYNNISDGTGSHSITKAGAGSIFLGGYNTYSGGTIISGGRVLAGSTSPFIASAGTCSTAVFGSGGVTVADGAQAFLTGNSPYETDFTIAGIGDNGGALKLVYANITGDVTVAGPARIGVTNGYFAFLNGSLNGSAPLEINTNNSGVGSTLYLNGDASGYTGNLTNNQGRLNLGSAANLGGSLAIADAASLGYRATSIAGDLTLGQTTGTTIYSDITNNSPLAIAGNLTLNGVTINQVLRLPASSPVTLMTYGGTLSGSAANLDLAGGIANYRPGTSFLVGGGSVQLNFVQGSETWTGVAGSAWNFADGNWSGTSSTFFNLDNVTFDDTGANKTIAIASPVTIGDMTVNNSVGNDYTFNGVLTGGSLTKSGTGQLNLLGTNNFTGPININGGTVAVTNTLGSASFALGERGGNINLNGGKLMLLGGDGGATPALYKNLVVTGNGNAYTNAKAATMMLVGDISGSGTLSIDLTNTASFFHLGSMASFTGTLIVNSFTNGVASGTAGGLQMAFNDDTVNTTGNAAARFAFNGGGRNTSSMGHSLMSNNRSGTCYMGELSGTGGAVIYAKTARNGDVTLETGALGTSSSFDGVLKDVFSTGGAGAPSGFAALHLKKVGGGTLTLSGVSTYTGNTTISGGTLAVASSGRIGSVGSSVYQPTIDVQAGATWDVSAVASGGVAVLRQNLIGKGNIVGLLTNNWVFSPGEFAGDIGTLTFSVSPVLNSNLVMELNTGNAQTADKIVVSSGPMVYGGTLILSNVGPALVAGDTFTIATAASHAGTIAGVSPATPGAGLAWDVVSLTNTGILKVHANPVANADEASCQHAQTTTIEVAKLLLNDTGELGETLSVTAVSANASLSLGVVTYTAPLTGTSDVITYTLSDGRGGIAIGTINVTLTSSGSSYNQLTPVILGNGDLRLTYLGIPGTNYALEVTHDLTPPVTWSSLLTNPAAGNGYLIFTNTPSQFPTNDFYRTRYVP